MVFFLPPEYASLSFNVNINIGTAMQLQHFCVCKYSHDLHHKKLWQVTQLLQTWSVQDFTLATQLKPYLQNSTAVTGQVETMWPDMFLIAMPTELLIYIA